MHRVALALPLFTACLPSTVTPCGEAVCPADSVCRPDGSCASTEAVRACEGDPDDCSTSQIPSGRCLAGVCVALSCGDGVRTDPEPCEGDDLGGNTCADLGYYQGDLACTASCGFDVTGCAERCGDGVRNGPELCDGVLPETSCLEYGFDVGLAACSSACGADFGDCAQQDWATLASLPGGLVVALDERRTLVDATTLGLVIHDRETGAVRPAPLPAGRTPFELGRTPNGEVYALTRTGTGQLPTLEAYLSSTAEPLMWRREVTPQETFHIAVGTDDVAIATYDALLVHPLGGDAELTLATTSPTSITYDMVTGALLWTEVGGGPGTGSLDGDAGPSTVAARLMRRDGSSVTEVAALPLAPASMLARSGEVTFAGVVEGVCWVGRVVAGSAELVASLGSAGEGACKVEDWSQSVGPVVSAAGTYLVPHGTFFEQIATPGLADLAIGGDTLIAVGTTLAELQPRRWQLVEAGGEANRFGSLQAVGPDAYLVANSAGVALHAPDARELVAPGDRLACGDPAAQLVTATNSLERCVAGDCTTVVFGTGGSFISALACRGTGPAWFSYNTVSPGITNVTVDGNAPVESTIDAGARGLDVLANGHALAVVSLADGWTVADLAPDASYTVRHQQPAPLTAIWACDDDRWFAGGVGEVVIADADGVHAEPLPYLEPVVAITGSSCDDAVAVTSTHVFERRSGAWRPGATPFISANDAVLVDGDLLVSTNGALWRLRR
ncbi:MAG: hypothetical protein R2939_20345 [Kofleriaceae bacterium]